MPQARLVEVEAKKVFILKIINENFSVFFFGFLLSLFLPRTDDTLSIYLEPAEMLLSRRNFRLKTTLNG